MVEPLNFVSLEEKDFAAGRAAYVATLPRIKVLLGTRNWGYHPWSYAFGVMWDKDPVPDEGAYIYRKRIILHLTFHASLERSSFKPNGVRRL
jgi:hypothetical protein